jgi:hypothetical protein
MSWSARGSGGGAACHVLSPCARSSRGPVHRLGSKEGEPELLRMQRCEADHVPTFLMWIWLTLMVTLFAAEQNAAAERHPRPAT